MPMRREKLGSIWIDTATVIVGDPCQLLPDERRDRPKRTYGDFMEQRYAQGIQPEPHIVIVGGERMEFPNPRESAEIVRLPSKEDGSAAIAVPTLENCDGWAHVYLERDSQGRPRRLIVDLSTKVQP